MSQALVWQLVRKNNCFVQKRSGVTFSRETGNVKNVHSYKYSGISSNVAVDAFPAAGGGVVIATRTLTPKNASKPKNSVVTKTLKKSRRKAIATAAKVVSECRPDLEQDIIAKVSGLSRASPVATKAPGAVASE